MWKAALILLVAIVALVGGLLQSTTTLDARNDPCVAVPDACAPEADPNAAVPPSTTTTPATTVTTALP